MVGDALLGRVERYVPLLELYRENIPFHACGELSRSWEACCREVPLCVDGIGNNIGKIYDADFSA